MTVTGFGPYVDQVGRYGGTASSGWVFKVNDVSPPVGADKVVLKDGDRVLWYYATFGPTGGPPTLSVKASKKGCYVAHGLRRQRQGCDRDRPRLPHRLEAHGQGQPERRRLSGSASGRARPRDGDRCGPLERREVRLAVVLLLAFAVTGCGGEREHGTATLWVTKDRGAHLVYSGTVPAGLTAMQALDRKLDITTRYGGRFVQSIGGVQGSVTSSTTGSTSSTASRAIEAPARRSCSQATSNGGTTARWRGKAISVPFVVGSYPASVSRRHDERHRRRCRAEGRAHDRRSGARHGRREEADAELHRDQPQLPPDHVAIKRFRDGALLELGAAVAQQLADDPKALERRYGVAP